MLCFWKIYSQLQDNFKTNICCIQLQELYQLTKKVKCIVFSILGSSELQAHSDPFIWHAYSTTRWCGFINLKRCKLLKAWGLKWKWNICCDGFILTTFFRAQESLGHCCVTHLRMALNILSLLLSVGKAIWTSLDPSWEIHSSVNHHMQSSCDDRKRSRDIERKKPAECVA